jgi:uncharacterized membrane protein YjgN (DUF898 family)
MTIRIIHGLLVVLVVAVLVLVALGWFAASSLSYQACVTSSADPAEAGECSKWIPWPH